MSGSTKLVPTAQWEYALYKVNYYADEAHTQLLRTDYIASSYECHLVGDIEERGPWSDKPYWYTWEPVVDSVPHPRKIGHLYGIPMYESGHEHGRREAIKRGLING